MRSLAVLALATALGGCMSNMVSRSDARGSELAAELIGSDGTPRGTARVETSGGGMRMKIEGIDLPPGVHGVHIHAVGRCERPAFESAGPHWNPAVRQHGRDNPMGAHRGDLPNLLIGTDGRGDIAFDLAGGPGDLLDADGSAIVIHADADDFRTDPSGNSGARLACGVFAVR